MKTRKCKYCSNEFTPYTSLQKNCFHDVCVKAMIKEHEVKQWNKKKAKLKKDLMTASDWLKIAQTTFNKFIRLRDTGLNCISCGEKPKKENAGHFWSAGGHANVRFNEENVHLQCERCNQYLSGNLLMYNNNLLYKIGSDRFIKLHEQAHITKRWTIEELHKINETYKQKIKELKKLYI